MGATDPSKKKRRTNPHQKHSVFPSMRTPKGVKIEGTSIRPIRAASSIPPAGKTAPVSSETLVVAYEAALRKLQATDLNKCSMPLASRQSIEDVYGRAYQALVKNKLAFQIRGKYR